MVELCIYWRSSPKPSTLTLCDDPSHGLKNKIWESIVNGGTGGLQSPIESSSPVHSTPLWRLHWGLLLWFPHKVLEDETWKISWLWSSMTKYVIGIMHALPCTRKGASLKDFNTPRRCMSNTREANPGGWSCERIGFVLKGWVTCDPIPANGVRQRCSPACRWTTAPWTSLSCVVLGPVYPEPFGTLLTPKSLTFSRI